MSSIKSVLLVGVGGQGTILASNVLSKGLVEAGYDVKMSEVHGMAQRGGSVTTQIRFGEKVYSPIIGRGEADILVSFELMEALRLIEFLKPGGKVIVNNQQIPSAPILAGRVDYPEGILEELQLKADTKAIDAVGIAKELGNEKAMNIVLFGALSKVLELDNIDWEDVIRNTVKEKFIDLNINAYRAGRNI
ncbi:indolepyruvate oxidoreductase subunit beta [Tissierella pigra]|uniref:Indolepyruvate oxidoreductase subunit beta n=1 Tax=Tissierella pigra TaxID=2607614 RepID=A0A6N7XZH1_9FIRM|nr:indolepyruvate oxidoreductase subunit beta [Tissierella pigra]MBU5428118.1 indolepyruvate oxidoreductase subunit beta [Tissierella pigra]MSU01974.1 indolepyruvate oxidoreductase subunit beta [Tissierella pigra]